MKATYIATAFVINITADIREIKFQVGYCNTTISLGKGPKAFGIIFRDSAYKAHFCIQKGFMEASRGSFSNKEQYTVSRYLYIVFGSVVHYWQQNKEKEVNRNWEV